MAARFAVRPITKAERSAWEPLWQGYLQFYKAEVPAAATDTAWARLHDPSEPMFALGAYTGDALKGIVHYL
ncbi:MAG TPA: GNAT family N-acetyltransferase, partial [Xanthobacteraceae bacterium]|nr:GNAT family N-acetyltransferase [Xanthobacteraceae bacterium]